MLDVRDLVAQVFERLYLLGHRCIQVLFLVELFLEMVKDLAARRRHVDPLRSAVGEGLNICVQIWVALTLLFGRGLGEVELVGPVVVHLLHLNPRVLELVLHFLVLF